jgi:O-antigen/teichoic acid export membrane protein
VPLVLGLLVLAPFLCVTVFGAEFGGSVEMLRILAVGGFGIVAMKLFGSALIAQRRPVLETIATASAFGATLALDVLLIPGYGGVGASIASTAAYSLGGLAVAAIAARTFRLPFRSLVPTFADVRSARGMLGVLRGRTA